MKRFRFPALVLFTCMISAQWMQGAKYTTFDVAGAQGTYAQGINSAGLITGYYYDGSTNHGFVRSADGAITEFDAPDAGAGYYRGTFPYRVNDGGTVTGYYINSYGDDHGFVRTADGTITEFDPPGAVDTWASGINAAGAIAGYYWDGNLASHGFIRAPDGAITDFDVPGASGTSGTSINSGGAIAGWYWDGNGSHGFIRAADGSFTEFDAFGLWWVTGINSSGIVAGSCWGNKGFVRTADGAITGFSIAVKSLKVTSINDAGVVAGYFNARSKMGYHGFLRKLNGVHQTLNAPGAGRHRDNGTWAMDINQSMSIAGYYLDIDGHAHGFLRQLGKR